MKRTDLHDVLTLNTRHPIRHFSYGNARVRACTWLGLDSLESKEYVTHIYALEKFRNSMFWIGSFDASTCGILMFEAARFVRSKFSYESAPTVSKN